MRKLLLTLVIILSAVGFATHAQTATALEDLQGSSASGYTLYRISSDSDVLAIINRNTLGTVSNLTANDYGLWILEDLGDISANQRNARLRNAITGEYLTIDEFPENGSSVYATTTYTINSDSQSSIRLEKKDDNRIAIISSANNNYGIDSSGAVRPNGSNITTWYFYENSEEDVIQEISSKMSAYVMSVLNIGSWYRISSTGTSINSLRTEISNQSTPFSTKIENLSKIYELITLTLQPNNYLSFKDVKSSAYLSMNSDAQLCTQTNENYCSIFENKTSITAGTHLYNQASKYYVNTNREELFGTEQAPIGSSIFQYSPRTISFGVPVTVYIKVGDTNYLTPASSENSITVVKNSLDSDWAVSVYDNSGLLKIVQSSANEILAQWKLYNDKRIGLISAKAISDASAIVKKASAIPIIEEALNTCAQSINGKIVTIQNAQYRTYLYLNSDKRVVPLATDNTLNIDLLWVIGFRPTTFTRLNQITLRSYNGNNYWSPSINDAGITTSENEDDAAGINLFLANSGNPGFHMSWKGIGASSGDVLESNPNQLLAGSINNYSPQLWKFAEVILPQEVSLDVEEASVEMSGSLTLTPSVKPDNVTEGWGDLTWNNEGEDYFTLENGVITPKAAGGPANVSVSTINNLTATAAITVIKEQFAVAFDPKTFTITADESKEVAVAIAKAGEEGSDPTPYTGDWTATLSDGTNTIEGKVTIADSKDKLTIAPLEPGTYTLTIAPADEATYEFADASMAFTVEKTPLESIAVSIGQSDKELPYENTPERSVEVTITPNPTTYDLSAGSLAATLLSDHGPKELTLTDSDGTYSVAIPAETAPGSYQLRVTYTEGSSITMEATADHSIIIATPAITGISYQEGDEVAVKIGKTDDSATLAVVIEANPEGAVFTGKSVTWTIAKQDSDSAEGLTIAPAEGDDDADNELAFTITATTAGIYTLTPSITGVDATLDALTVAVTKAEKELIIASVTAATVEPVTLAQTGTDTFTATGEATFTVTLGEDSEPLAENNLDITAAGVHKSHVTIAADASAAGAYNITVAFTATEVPAEDAEASITLTITGSSAATAPSEKAVITIAKPALTITEIVAPDAAEVDAEATGLTALFSISVAEGSAWPAASDFNVTGADGITTSEATIEPKDDQTVTEFTLTVPYTASAAGSITVAAKEGNVDPAVATVTIKPVLTIEAITAPEAAEIDADATDLTAIFGITVATGSAEPTVDDLTIAATAGVTAGEATIAAKDGSATEFTLTVPYTASEAGTIIVAAKNSTLDPAVATITIKQPEQPEEPGSDLEVKAPEADEIPAGAVVSVVDHVATVGFNSTPAEGEATMTIALPAAAEAIVINPDDYTITYSADEVAKATIEADGSVTIEALSTEVGASTTVTIAAKASEPEAALMADDETAETPALLTINVTIFGVEFTKAPSAVTLPASGTATATFTTKAVTADDAAEVTLECEGAEVSGDVITFAKAGSYIVTAKVGDDYSASTTVTVKDAPTVVGIDAVNADAAAGAAVIYDLGGRRLSRVNAAGIYIVNGVRTLIR